MQTAQAEGLDAASHSGPLSDCFLQIFSQETGMISDGLEEYFWCFPLPQNQISRVLLLVFPLQLAWSLWHMFMNVEQPYWRSWYPLFVAFPSLTAVSWWCFWKYFVLGKWFANPLLPLVDCLNWEGINDCFSSDSWALNSYPASLCLSKYHVFRWLQGSISG